MPELPEVETIVRDVGPYLVGRRLSRVEVGRQRLRRPWSPEWSASLTGRRVEEVTRRGKWILVALEGGWYLVIHLGMTGQLTIVAKDEPRPDHTHVVFGLEPGPRQLRFRDIRRFGSVQAFAGREPLDRFFHETGLGPEPFALGAGYWRGRLATTGRCLKAVLLDQRVVAGVGNIYADESLFEARLHPSRLGRELTRAEADRLRRAVQRVLCRAIERRGSTIRDYVGGAGLRGQYQDEFRVYGRTGWPCRRCQTQIERIRLAGRATHYCPHCQKQC